MRSREAWLAAIAAVLGVSDGACKRDADATPAAVRDVPSASSVASAPAAIDAESAAPSASAIVIASASATATEVAKTPPTAATSTQRHAPASCGAVPTPNLGDIHGNPIEQVCGARQEVKPPRAVIAQTVSGAAPGDERVIAAARPRVRSCANKGLQVDPNETGKAVVTVSVAANGDVTSSSVTSATGLGGQTTACMANVFRSSTFGAGAARSIVVTIVQTIEGR